MKKAIIILSVITVIGFTSCSRAEYEKNPVVIKDVVSPDNEVKPEVSKKESTVKDETTTLTIELEGMKEEINGVRHTGDGYEIVYDSDRLKYSKKDGIDCFIKDNADPAIYPNVYLCINHLKDKNASDYVKKLSDTLSANGFKTEIKMDASIGNYKGTILTAKAGSEWNSIIRNYYIIEKGTSMYTIETQYFVDAAEGFGVRIQAMLNTFKIIND